MPAKHTLNTRKIGLALSGGGARGFAHIGVIKTLVENGMSIDMVAGTSAGSIAGGALASGMSVAEILEMASRISWSNVLRPSLTPLGFFSTAPIGSLIRREFPVLNIEEMPVPFAAVACDFADGRELVFTEGDAAFAIRASCAVPGVFAPMIDNEGRLLVDGGVVAPTPVDAVQALGADIVIAVDLMACGASFRSRPRTALGMMLGSAMRLLTVASRTQSVGADVMIVPQIAHLRPDQIDKRDEFIALGEAAALEALPAIRELCS